MKLKMVVFIVIGVFSFCFGQSSYYPLKKGTVLNYSYHKAFFENQAHVDVSNLKFTIKTLEKTEIINQKEYFILETSGALIPSSKSYTRVDDQGSIIGYTELDKEEFIFLNKNPTVGDSYRTSGGSGSSETKVIDLKGTIQTPLKTYDSCLVLEVKENETVQRIYLSEGIGMVAMSIIINNEETLFLYLSDTSSS